MGDWDDDDFVPVLPSLSAKNNFADEEDGVEVEPAVVVKVPTPAELAKRAQKLAEEEEKLASQLKFALLEGETEDDRKARERRQVEEADNKLTEELLGGGKSKSSSAPVASNDAPKKSVSSLGSSSATGGLAAISLATKQDHTNFGITCSKKLAESTPIYVCAFYKALSERLPPKMTTESLDEILAVLQKVRDEKKKVEGEVAKSTAQKKSKKEIKAAEKKHNDIFGGSKFADKLLDEYADYEDEFM